MAKRGRGRPRGGERALGPYGKPGDRRRVVFVDGHGNRAPETFPTQRKAELAAAAYNEAAKQAADLTTQSLFEDYRRHLKRKGNVAKSVYQTMWALERFFYQDFELGELSVNRCRKLYDRIVDSISERTQKPLSVSSHRGILAQARSFLRWCVKQGYIRINPLEEIDGVGKRNTRKAQLRYEDAQVFYELALWKGARGDEGAIAALCAFELGKRASDITRLCVGDVQGQVVYVDKSKTKESEKPVKASNELAGLLADLGEGKQRGAPLFPAHSTSGFHDRDWVRAQVKRICRMAEVPEVTAHGLRGTVATIGLEGGMDGEDVARLLGHRDQRTTRGSYAKKGAGESATRARGLRVLAGGKR